MKKLLILSAMIFALAFIPALSYAVGTGNPSNLNSIAGGHKSTKRGEGSLDYQASRVIGAAVKNKEGDLFGEITDLMIDPQSGGVAFAVVSRGGVLGIPMRFVVVPFSALASTSEKRVYLLEMSQEKIAEAPSLNRYPWPDMADQAWGTETSRSYGQSPNWEESNKSTAYNWSKEKGYDFKKIVGTPVKNQQGEELGKIRDMVVSSRGHVPFAILSHGGFWGIDEKLVAVPLGALSFDRTKKELVLTCNEKELDSAPSFQASDLSNHKWAEDVYRHFGQQPHWTE